MPKQIGKLTRQSDFNFVYRTGRRLASPLFIVRYAKGGRDATKFAVVASVKAVGKAIKRNRARRRVWQAINKQFRIFPKTGYLIVFILKKLTVTAPWDNILSNVGNIGKNLR